MFEGKSQQTKEKSKVSPIPPRFTDYYSFATQIKDIADERLELAHQSDTNLFEESQRGRCTEVEPKNKF
ncbi:LOW QUALITY PROTEIN: hypothetical protein HJC23_006505 [Cyclotella cryptica]|uniref:Uncharacterized protein n=1 Tax=Cyclotella cryptica TaxID=29204 RepID=A0ABD3PQ57_9STRA